MTSHDVEGRAELILKLDELTNDQLLISVRKRKELGKANTAIDSIVLCITC